MSAAPYTAFGKTKNVPVEVYENGKYSDDRPEWDDELWVERGEDWYGLMAQNMKNKRVRVIQRDKWLRAKEIE